jgi:opacity protein-like surface antigen
MMNKILIAIVLAVVMSGNAYAQDLYIYCKNSWNEGYSLSKDDTSHSYRYSFGSQEKIIPMPISISWSSSDVKFSRSGSGYRINRKTLSLEALNYNPRKEYVFHSQCDLVDSKNDLIKIIENKRAEKTKGNKF